MIPVIFVIIGCIDHLANTSLDNQFGTLPARLVCAIEGCAPDVCRLHCRYQGIDLSVYRTDTVVVLDNAALIHTVCRLRGTAIIARAQDAVILDHDCPNREAGAGSAGRDDPGDVDEVLVPATPHKSAHLAQISA